MKKIDNDKYFALLEEFETSNKLIKLGFGELQNINISNDFYFLPFQLLSQGFERFMKAYICLGYLYSNESLPNTKYLKDLGHDLEKLLKEIIKSYFKNFNRVQFLEDKSFIENDDNLKELLYILSEFGKISRYHNFNIITGDNNIGINAIQLWQDFENKIMNTNEKSLKEITDFNLENEIYEEITSHIIIVFEKFISSLSRQFIFDCLGQIGKQLTANSFFDFGLLYQKDFGKTDYRKNTTKYKETLKSTYKRTILDEFNRSYNPNYKSKRLKREDYTGDWPFYSDEVIIECRNRHWCLITIEGNDYALNGSAKGRYKLENPHDAGMAILGKSIDGFIKLALEL